MACTYLSVKPSDYMKPFSYSFLAALIVISPWAHSYDEVIDSEDDFDHDRAPMVIFPYAFATELLGTGAGVFYVQEGQFQPQDSVFLTAYVTNNDSFGIAGAWNRARFGESRWFASPLLSAQRNGAQRFYSELGFGVGDTPGGSNESSQDEFLEGSGWDVYTDVTFRYVVPAGLGADDIVHRFETSQGLLTAGSTHGRWNPLRSGRTILIVQPFLQYRTMIVDEENINEFPTYLPVELGEEVRRQTNGVTVSLEYDNRDFDVNPEHGSWQKIKVSRDFGWLGSSESWTALEFDVSKLFSLGKSEHFRQRVLALRAWTAYVPTRTLTTIDDEIRVDNSPPDNMGATLGGDNRLRAYPSGRFNDKAAIYYSAELRVIPEWNPMKGWPLIRRFAWRWWQWVAFAEVGRVAPSWSFQDLHEDIKWSAGLGLRAMIGSGVIRAEVATSTESTQLVLMVNHPF